MLQNKEEVEGNDEPSVVTPQIEKNERITNEIDMMLKEAYVTGNYAKALDFLQHGASGSVYLDSNVPLLYDLYKNYEQGLVGTDLLFEYYLRNRKNCFKDFLDGIYPDQTVGSYIAHFGSLDLLQKMADEKIPINSEKENPEDTALFDMVAAEWTYNMANQTFGGLKYNEKEKRRRIRLLLEAGADVTLLRTYDGGTIFHSFRWYPEEEDFTDVLDKMIELGASPQVL
ncbi:MAG: hypothetical protein LBR10_07250, partial [Prevotellaceae bacterium]|nr:hypothetical protein [Prevotellaceae bacterium]